MPDINLSYYKNAKDNKGTIKSLQQIVKLLTDNFINDVTTVYRTQYLPPLRHTEAEFKSVIAGIESEWKTFTNDRKELAKARLQLEKGYTNNREGWVQSLESSLNVYLKKFKGVSEAVELETAYNKAKERAGEYKTTKFPAVTFFGTFGKRAIANLGTPSGLMVMDVDHLSTAEIEKYSKLLKHDPHVLLCFISPGGEGLKIIFKIPINEYEPLQIWLCLAHYLKKGYGLDADVSGKDVSRLCFIPYDSNYHFNDGAVTIDIPALLPFISEKEKPAPKPKKQLPAQPASTQLLDEIFEFTKQGKYQNSPVDFAPGQRNNFLFVFASNCARKGVSKDDCKNYMDIYLSDKPESEVTATINSAYKSNDHQFGKYAKRTKNNAGNSTDSPLHQQGARLRIASQTKEGADNAYTANAAGIQSANNQQPTTNTNPAPFTRFWYIKEKTDKQGNTTQSFNIDYNKLKSFLVEQGFYRLPLKDGNYQFIKITGNQVKPVMPLHIKDFIFEFLENLDEYEATNSLTRGGKQFLSTDKFERLPYKNVECKKHTENAAYFYFKNGCVEVTPDDIVLHSPESLANDYIWQNSVNPRAVKLMEDITKDGNIIDVIDQLEQSEVYRFLWLACCNKNNRPADEKEANKYDNDHDEKFLSVLSSIGYLLHQYKTPSKAKAIVAIDHQIPADRTEQNGGTGKSIIGNYILKNMLHVSTIPGKDYKDDNAWRWEPITIDSQVVFFNDVKYNFNFEGIFELITDDMLINRRNIGYLHIPFEISPKIYLATNFVPKGDGTSFRRRTHIIEFDNYFNETHTPYDEFGHNMFNDWKGDLEEQWNMYYNLLFHCVQIYLKEGLLPYPSGNYDARKLMSDCPQEFIDWMDATDDVTHNPINVRRNEWIEKKELFANWCSEAKAFNFPPPSAHIFTKMVKKYCHTRGVEFNHKKTNGKEYYVFGKPSTSQPFDMPKLFNS